MPRFVILRHETAEGEYHWDLLFESPDGPLLSYSLPPRLAEELLSVRKGIVSGPVRRLPDHRPYYLDYEGPVSGDRGSVRKIDDGEFSMPEPNCFEIEGRRFRGTVQICSDAQPADPAHDHVAIFHLSGTVEP